MPLTDLTGLDGLNILRFVPKASLEMIANGAAAVDFKYILSNPHSRKMYDAFLKSEFSQVDWIMPPNDGSSVGARVMVRGLGLG
jgi:hypothetical protein